jgi:hypothetical protein
MTTEVISGQSLREIDYEEMRGVHTLAPDLQRSVDYMVATQEAPVYKFPLWKRALLPLTGVGLVLGVATTADLLHDHTSQNDSHGLDVGPGHTDYLYGQTTTFEIPQSSGLPYQTGVPEHIGKPAASFDMTPLAEKRAKGLWVTIGDSIIEQYNSNPHSVLEGFDDVAARELGYHTYRDGVGRSGYDTDGKLHPNQIKAASMSKESTSLKEDNYCDTNRRPNSSVLDRLKTPRLQRMLKKASKVLLEAGRNDHNRCDEDGNLVKTSPVQLKSAVTSSFAIVASLVKKAKDVLVVVPWGINHSARQGKRITRIIKHAAHEYGFTFVKTWGRLTNKDTVDGIHPNRRGVLAMAKALIYRSFLKHELPKS